MEKRNPARWACVISDSVFPIMGTEVTTALGIWIATNIIIFCDDEEEVCTLMASRNDEMGERCIVVVYKLSLLCFTITIMIHHILLKSTTTINNILYIYNAFFNNNIILL